MKRIVYAREDLVNNARVVPSRNVFAPHMWPGLGHLVLILCCENKGKVENYSWTQLTFLWRKINKKLSGVSIFWENAKKLGLKSRPCGRPRLGIISFRPIAVRQD